MLALGRSHFPNEKWPGPGRWGPGHILNKIKIFLDLVSHDRRKGCPYLFILQVFTISFPFPAFWNQKSNKAVGNKSLTCSFTNPSNNNMLCLPSLRGNHHDVFNILQTHVECVCPVPVLWSLPDTWVIKTTYYVYQRMFTSSFKNRQSQSWTVYYQNT